MKLCRHLGECGGCSIQEMEYGEQLASKAQRIKDLFPGQEVSPIVPCANPWRYRNKMEFSFSQDKKGNRYLGLMIRKGRGRVVNLYECHLTSSWYMGALSRVREWWEGSGLHAYFPPKNVGHLRTLTLREGINTGEKMAMLTVAPETDATGFAELLPEATTLIRYQHSKKGSPTRFEETVTSGSGMIHEELCGLRFRIGPSAFFQPNTRQAEKLYPLALELMGPADCVYDLYCGTGTLGILAAGKAERVVGVELNAQACRDARVNIELNGLKNVEIIEGDVGKIALEAHPDAVLVDPPRMGLSPEALAHLISLMSKKIVYISCNPVSQAENVAALTAAGYTIRAIQPVDQFPHTTHIENIVSLESNE